LLRPSEKETINALNPPAALLRDGGQGTTASVPLLVQMTQPIEARTIILGNGVSYPSMATKEFYPHPATARNELHITHPGVNTHGGKKVVIVQLKGTLFMSSVTGGSSRDTLVRTLVNSRNTTAQYPKGWNGVIAQYLPAFTVTLSGNRKVATVYFPHMPLYDLPPNGWEELYVVPFPASILDQMENQDVANILGTTLITIRQRTLHFEPPTLVLPQKAFYNNNTLTDPISESLLAIALYAHYRIQIRLDCIPHDYECKFAPDVGSSASKRLALVQGLFTHGVGSSASLAEMPEGIQSSWAAIAASAHSVVISNNDRTLVYIVPHLPKYNLPKGTVEQVRAHEISGACFFTPNGQTGHDLIEDFVGVHSADVIAVHAFYSGNFFVPEVSDSQALWAPTLIYAPNRTQIKSYLNDATIRRGRRWGEAPFNVTITLVGQRFAADIVTRVDLRDRIIASILAPKPSSVHAPGQETTIYRQVQPFGCTGGSETTIASGGLSLAECAKRVAGAGYQFFSYAQGVGSCFTESACATHAGLGTYVGYGIIAPTPSPPPPGGYRLWQQWSCDGLGVYTALGSGSLDVCATKAQALGGAWQFFARHVQSGLCFAYKTCGLTSNFHYHAYQIRDGCEARNQASCPGGMSKWVSQRYITNLIRVLDNKAVLWIAPLQNYSLAKLQVDYIHTKDLPNDALEVAGYIERSGQYQVEVRARSAEYRTVPGEAFFGPGLTGSKYLTDHDIRFAQWSVLVYLEGETFRQGALMHNPGNRRTVDYFDCGVREAVLSSNRNSSEYRSGMATLAGAEAITMTLIDTNTLKITLGGVEAYEGKASSNELIVPQPIPGLCTSQRDDAVAYKASPVSMSIFARTAIFGGTFFTNVVSDADVRSTTAFTVVIDLIYEKWAADIESAQAKQIALLRAVFNSNREAGYPDFYAHGFQSNCYASVCGGVKRVNDSRVTVELYSLPSYVQAPNGNELIQAAPVPGEALASVPINPIKLHTGTYSSTVHQRTAFFSGDLYTHRTTTSKWLHTRTRYLRIDISYDTWAADLLANTTKGKILLHGVMTSTHHQGAAPNGVHSLIEQGLIALTPQSFIGGLSRSLLVAIPPLIQYTSFPEDSETVTFTTIPGECLASGLNIYDAIYPGPFPPPSTARSEQYSTVIFAKAVAIYSGSFFSPGARPPSYLTLETGTSTLTVSITLLDAQWAPDLVTDLSKRDLLLATQVKSNKRRGAPDYAVNGWEGMTAPKDGVLNGGIKLGVLRRSSTQVEIQVGKMDGYDLPEGMQEIIQALPIPKALLEAPGGNAALLTDVSIKYGITALTVHHSFGVFENIGIGRGQWATQSSVTAEFPKGYAYKGVDGAFNTDYRFGNCIKTQVELQPWWRVELDTPQWVRHVTIVTPARVSVLGRVYQNLTVAVGDGLGAHGVENAACGNALVKEGESEEYMCARLHGRYVVVFSPVTNNQAVAMSVCEVQIYSAGPLISDGRPTTQSSTHWRYRSDLAVDGNRANVLSLGSCMHTLTEESPWWRVALDSTHRVQAVVIANRADAFGNRLSGAQVLVGDGAMGIQHGISRMPQCGGDFTVPQRVVYGTGLYNSGMKHYLWEVVCTNGALPGRFVYVTIPGPQKTLAMCEVEVYGLACDAECLAKHEVPASPVGGSLSGTPGVPSGDHSMCRATEEGNVGHCNEPAALASGKSHVSTWGVDH
jgi:hypothetical protein